MSQPVEPVEPVEPVRAAGLGRSSAGSRIAIDRVACTGHGICARILPDDIGLDEWGYPILRRPGGSTVSERDATVAVKLCPARALFRA